MWGQLCLLLSTYQLNNSIFTETLLFKLFANSRGRAHWSVLRNSLNTTAVKNSLLFFVLPLLTLLVMITDRMQTLFGFSHVLETTCRELLTASVPFPPHTQAPTHPHTHTRVHTSFNIHDVTSTLLSEESILCKCFIQDKENFTTSTSKSRYFNYIRRVILPLKCSSQLGLWSSQASVIFTNRLDRNILGVLKTKPNKMTNKV